MMFKIVFKARKTSYTTFNFTRLPTREGNLIEGNKLKRCNSIH